jgi:hypothetical protein
MEKNGILLLTIVLLITGCNKKGNGPTAPDFYQSTSKTMTPLNFSVVSTINKLSLK